MAARECEGISHRTIQTNGIKMHIAEQGSGPVVLLLHGFPELWYSWRHQMTALAAAGYHAVAPDMRGYGETEAPPGYEQYTSLHLVGDIVGLLDALDVKQVYLVGHDWGAQVGWDLCLFRPDRVKAYVALSVPYTPRKAGFSPVTGMRRFLGDGFYFCRFQEPGRAEADFARFDTKTTMKKVLLMEHSLVCPEDKELLDVLETPKQLPAWMSEEELDYFAEQFSRTGFTGGLNYYRAADLSWQLKAPWTVCKIHVPVLHITGDRDVVYNFPGNKDYIHKGEFKANVPNLEDVVVLPSAHFLQQEKPEEVNQLLTKFFEKHQAKM